MSFLTWAALAIGLLVAAPIVAHLLRRRPPQEQPFSATRMVPESPAVSRRRTALEDRALLSIRALAIIGLALLGATPFIRCPRLSLARSSGASIALAIVLDDSLSMRAPLPDDPGRTRFDKAAEAARELLAGLRSGDTIALVLAGKPARVALASTSNLGTAAEVLEQITQSDRGTDLDEALSLASELLRDLQHVDKRVVLLSDLADGSGSDRQLEVAEGLRLWVPLAELQGAQPNCGVIEADQAGTKVVAKVACGPLPRAAGSDAGTGAGSAAGAARPGGVRLLAGSDVLAELPLKRQGGTQRLLLELPQKPMLKPRAPGEGRTAGSATSGAAQQRDEGQEEPHAAKQLTVALSGAADAIAADDRAPVVAVGEQLRAGIVSDPAENRVPTGGPPPAEQAFAALRLGVQLRPLPTVPEQPEELEELGLLIVDDVPGFTPEARRALAGWVDRGGVLLITLGPGAAAAPLGAGFAPLLPGLIRWQKTAVKGVAADTDELFGETVAGLADLNPSARAELDLPGDAAVKVLARWRDGAPFLLQRRSGRGHSFVVTLPFSTRYSDFALRPAFLVLLDRLVQTARTLGGAARTEVGATWRFDGFQQVKVSLVTAEDQPLPLPLEGAPGQWRATPPLLGLYDLELDGTTVSRIAAPPEQEVDLTPRPLPDDARSATLGGVTSSVDISAYVALILLGLLLAELVLRLLGSHH